MCNYKSTFGKRLKSIRKKRGYKTQAALASKLGVSLDTIQNWEQGATWPEMNDFLKMCDTLECDADYLFGRIDKRTHDLDFLSDMTGLSASAVESLHRIKKGEALDVMDDFLASSSYDFAYMLFFLRGRTEAAKKMLSFAKETKDAKKALEVMHLFSLAAYDFELSCREIANLYHTLDLRREAEQLAERLSKQERSKDNE